MSARQGDIGESDRGNYVVTAQRPTAIKTSCVGSFTSPEHLNLVISKVTRIEIHRLVEDGLDGILDVPIYGRVACMDLFRPPGKERDLLYFLTEKYKFCILEYDPEKGELISKAVIDTSMKVGRPVEYGALTTIDHQARVIAIQTYDGMLKVLYLNSDGGIKSTWDARIDELSVIDMKFLHTTKPTLALIYEEPGSDRALKTYEIPMDEKNRSMAEGPLTSKTIGVNASLIIPIPAPLGGAVVASQSLITYLSSSGGGSKSIEMDRQVIRAYSKVDPDGSRFLLGDSMGSLYLLVLAHDNSRVLGLKLERLGDTTATSTISYLDNGITFMGSSFGDSQLIKLHAQPVDPSTPNQFVEVLDTFTNLGPIVDFCAMDLDRQGQVQVVTCSGVRRDGSLRVIRSGIGLGGQVSVPFENIRGLWSLRASFDDNSDSLLAVSFLDETRILGMDEDDELADLEAEGFDGDSKSYFCGNMVGDCFVQITQTAVNVMDSARRRIADWKPPEGMTINVGKANASQVLVVAGKGNMVLLELQGNSLVEKCVRKFDVDVACVDISPLASNSNKAFMAAVGMWDQTVLLLRTSDLSTVLTEKLIGDVIARDVLFASLGPTETNYLLVAMGDGRLVNYLINAETGDLSDRKSISLGVRPLNLRTFGLNGDRFIFASSDRPTIIYSSNNKLLYSNLNEEEIFFMTPFNTKSFPGHMVLAKADQMLIGRIDEVQKLHVRTVPLGAQPRRIHHHAPSKSLIVILAGGQLDPEVLSGHDKILLVDETTFEILDSHELKDLEMGSSLTDVQFGDSAKSYVAVGTAHVVKDEPEPKSGNILLIEIIEGKLQIVATQQVHGAVYTMSPFQGKLLCGVNSLLQMYDLRQDARGSLGLTHVCTHSRGQILVLFIRTRGTQVITGDLTKSVGLMEYNVEEGCFEVLGRDHNAAWMLTIEYLKGDEILGAENSYNLFALGRNLQTTIDHQKQRLKTIGLFHIGEQINTFQKGSLVMQNTDNLDFKDIYSVLYATIAGSIGVVASLPKSLFKQLSDLEASMRSVVKGVANLDHKEWRSYMTELSFQPHEPYNFVDGDLIEQFLELDKSDMQKVVEGIPNRPSVEDIGRLVEELSRALH